MIKASKLSDSDNRLTAIGKECISFLEEKKALDITFLDLREISSYLDYFIICTGNSHLHCRNLAKSLEKYLTQSGLKLLINPDLESEWIILDYNEIIFHIFTEEKREYYDLDRLWADARKIV